MVDASSGVAHLPLDASGAMHAPRRDAGGSVVPTEPLVVPLPARTPLGWPNTVQLLIVVFVAQILMYSRGLRSQARSCQLVLCLKKKCSAQFHRV